MEHKPLHLLRVQQGQRQLQPAVLIGAEPDGVLRGAQLPAYLLRGVFAPDLQVCPVRVLPVCRCELQIQHRHFPQQAVQGVIPPDQPGGFGQHIHFGAGPGVFHRPAGALYLQPQVGNGHLHKPAGAIPVGAVLGCVSGDVLGFGVVPQQGQPESRQGISGIVHRLKAEIPVDIVILILFGQSVPGRDFGQYCPIRRDPSPVPVVEDIRFGRFLLRFGRLRLNCLFRGLGDSRFSGLCRRDGRRRRRLLPIGQRGGL